MLARNGLAAIALTLFASVAAGQVVTSITPASGSPPGGTIVHITGSGLHYFAFGCNPFFCTPIVTFGDSVAGVQPGSSDTDLIVIVPPHAPGLVDVRLWLKTFAPQVVLPAAFRYDPIDDGYVRVLLPVLATSAPGAGGSIWSSQVSVASDVSQNILTIAGLFNIGSLVDAMPAATIDAYGGAGFIHFPVSAAPSADIDTRIRDFRAHMRLLSIPTDPRFRLTLRIYSLYGVPAEALVTVLQENTLLQMHATVPLLSGDSKTQFTYQPARAQIALDSMWAADHDRRSGPTLVTPW